MPYRVTVPTTHTSVDANRNSFRNPPRSAIAPANGERTATVMAEIVTALDQSAVPSISFAAIAFAKYAE